jgi:hypothetical protein
MANSKLMKVMDYLINEQQDEARELLHQIFIEKARAIHEDMMNDDLEEEMLGGDEGEDLADDIEADMNEIDAEEHYAPMHEDDEDHEDVEDAVDDLEGDLTDRPDVMDTDHDLEDHDEDMDSDHDMDVDHEHIDTEMHQDHDKIKDELHDLEDALEKLHAEFEELKNQRMDHQDHEPKASEPEHDEVEETWEADTDDLEEDWDDLDESLDLDTVSVAKGGEVGAGKFARPDVSKHSPVPSSQRDMMGAKPVVTGKGPKHTGYSMEKAPDSKKTATTNRRKKFSDDMKSVSKEGDNSALLNKDRSMGFGSIGTKSPISGKDLG